MAVSGIPTCVAIGRAGWSVALAGLIACGASPTGAPEPPPPAVLEVLSGGGQEGVAGYLLDDRVRVRLRAADGTVLPFVAVRAAATGPFAAATPATAITDADGITEVDWRLGLALGPQELVLSAPGSPATSEVRVAATARSNAMRAIGGGVDVMCGIDGAGMLGCWQPSSDPDHPPRFVPHATAERFSTMALSPGIARPMDGCAVAQSGRSWCFTVSSSATILALEELPGAYPAFTALTVGGEASASWCGLTAEGAAWCWGDNGNGILGDGSGDDHLVPLPVETPRRFARLVVGPDHACGLDTAESIWCWGGNDVAQVGQPASASPFLVPTRVPTDLLFADLVVPHRFGSCGVERGSGHPWCWGEKTMLGVSSSTVAGVEGPYALFPLYVEPLVGVVGIGRVDAAAVVLRRGVVGAWWGDLTPTRDVTIAEVPQPFIATLDLGSLAIPHARGVVCGTPDGASAQLCVRFGVITGYETTAAAGFGMPFP